MKRKIGLMLTLAFAISGGAYAADDATTSAAPSDQGEVSRTEQPRGLEETTMNTQSFAIGPQVGVVTYTDNLGTRSARGTAGINVEWNLARLFTDSSRAYIALQTGGQVAKVGNGSANFFGGGSDNVGAFNDSTMVVIPADAKIGYNLSESARISAHGGGNVIYRSSAGAVRLAASDPAGNVSDWSIYPNVGGDLEVKVGKSVGLQARPDVTITPDETMFVGTLAANVMF